MLRIVFCMVLMFLFAGCASNQMPASHNQSTGQSSGLIIPVQIEVYQGSGVGDGFVLDDFRTRIVRAVESHPNYAVRESGYSLILEVYKSTQGLVKANEKTQVNHFQSRSLPRCHYTSGLEVHMVLMDGAKEISSTLITGSAAKITAFGNSGCNESELSRATFRAAVDDLAIRMRPHLTFFKVQVVESAVFHRNAG